MAITFTNLAATNASTANASSYIGNTGTTAANELLISCASASATIAAGTMTGGGLTWTRLTSFTKNAGGDTIYLFWAANITGNTITPVFDCTGDAAAGACIHCVRISGSEGQTVPSIRQWRASGASTANPSMDMYVPVLTGNGILGFAANGTNSATQWTAPGGWAENGEAAYNTPANSLEAASRSIGQTGTISTWVNVNATAWGAIVLEIWEPHARSAGGGAGGSSPMFY